MTTARTIPAAFSQGFALCDPAGKLLPKSWSDTEEDAIATRFRVRKSRAAAWEKAQAKGWTVEHVYVRVFIPIFKTSYSTTEIEEAYDVEEV